MKTMFERLTGRNGSMGGKAPASRPAVPGTGAPLAFALEPRFMFDAAGAATADPAAADHAADPAAADHASGQGDGQASGRPQADALVAAAASAVGSAPVTAAAPVEIRAAAPELNEGKREVVFIESNVADRQVLVDGMKAGVEVVLLDAGRDGLSQMAQWAQTHSGYDAIHLVSHGAEGQVSLGTLALDSATAGARAADLAALGAALTDDGDLLLYGCEVASGKGQAFIAAIAAATGADVAASTDTTGAASLGGNGTLEAATGAIQAGLAISDAGWQRFGHLLAQPTIADLNGDVLSYRVGSGAQVIDQGTLVSVADSDSVTFDTGTLTVSGGAAGDTLGIRNQGTGSGLIGVSGSNVTYGGAVIGSFTGGSGTTDLVVTLNGSATHEATSALLANITFSNASDVTATTRSIGFTLLDSSSGSASSVSTATISLTPNTTGTIYKVTNLNDSGAGSLRQAILDANDTIASAGADTIVFDSSLSGTIRLTSGALLVSDSLSIWGPGAGFITVNGDSDNDGTGDVAFMIIDDGDANTLSTVTVAGLAFDRGVANTLVNAGGAIDSVENLNLYGVSISNVVSPAGGGYFGNAVAIEDMSGNLGSSAPSFTMKNSSIFNSEGALYLEANTATIEDSRIYNLSYGDVNGNEAVIRSFAVDFTLRRTEISGLAYTGSSVANVMRLDPRDGGSVTFDNVTIVNNSFANASSKGAVLITDDGGAWQYTATIINSTIAGNTTGNTAENIANLQVFLRSSSQNPDDVITIKNSILYGSQASDTALRVAVESTGAGSGNNLLTLTNSIVGAKTGSFDTDTGNSTTAAGLVAAASNGGPTRTQAIGSGSSATNLGTSSGASGIDQRGFLRNVGNPDAGAYEYGSTQFHFIGQSRPLNGSVGVDPTANLEVDFGSPIAKGAGNIRIYDADTNALLQTIDVTAATVTLSGSKAIINPPANLPINANVYIEIDAGAFTASVDGGTNNATSLAMRGATGIAFTTGQLPAPKVTSIDRQTPSAATTNADSLVFRVTFNQDVINVDASDFTVTGPTNATISVSAVSGSAAVYDVTVSGGDLASLNGTVTLSFSGGQDISANSNPLSSTTPTGTNNPTYTLDNTAPGAPTIAIDLETASDTGSSSSDDLTRTTTPTLRVSLSGTNAVAGDTLELLLGGSALTSPRSRVLDSTDIGNGYYDFTVASGDLGADGAKVFTARVTDAAGNVGTAGGSLTVTLDTTAPTVTLTAPSDKTYKAGEVLTFTATLSEAVTVTNTPRLALTVGSQTVYATYNATTSTATSLKFDYTVAAGNLDADGIAFVAAALDLNSTGTIQDAAGNNATLTFSAPIVSGILVDGVAPTVTSIDRQTPSSATTNADTLVYRVTFSETLAATPANTDFSVSGTSGAVTSVTWVSGNAYDVTVSGGNLASFNGTVTLSFAGGQAITDSAGNALTVTTPTGTNNPTYTLDNTAPGAPTIAIDLETASDTGSSSSDDLTRTTTPTLRVSLSGTNAVAGDTLELLLGGSALTSPRSRVLDSTDIGNGYYDFTVASGDLGADGAKVFTARVTDAAGNVGTAGGSLTVTLDTTAPTVTVTRPTLSSPSGTDFTFTVVHSEGIDASTVSVNNVTVTGPGATTLTVTNATLSGSTVTYTVTAPGGTWDSADAGSYGIALGSSPAKDAAGNAVATLSHSFSVTFNAPPTIGNLASDSVVWAGVGHTVALDFNGNATVTDAENDTAGWSGGSLTVQRVTGGGTADATAKDVFSLNESGFTIDGTDLKDGGSVIFGSVTTNSGGVLTIAFNANATSALVQTVMRNILYRNDTPYGDTTIRFALSDGNSNTANADVTVTSTTIYVDQANDDGDGDAADGFSLREALARGAAQGGADTVTLSVADNSSITLGSGVTLGSDDTLDFATTDNVTITGSTVTLGGAANISVASDKSAKIESTVAGANTLVKSGAGTLTLSGTNSYGATTVTAGTLAVAGDGNLGSGAVTLGGGNLTVTGTTTIDNAVTLTADGTIQNSAAVTLSGVVSGAYTLTKSGGGALTLSNTTNSYGATTITAGTLSVTGDNNLGSGQVRVSGASSLEVTGTTTIDNALVLDANATLTNVNAVTWSGAVSGSSILTKAGAGTLTLSSTSNSSAGWGLTATGGTVAVSAAGNLGTGTVTLDGASLGADTSGGSFTLGNAVALGGANGTVSVGGSNALTLSGVLSGSGTLTKGGAGTLILSNTNTATGAVTVLAGGLTLMNGAAIDDSVAVTVASGATLTLGGGPETIGSLAGAGSVVLGYTLTMGENNGSTIFSGVISGNNNGIVKKGSGTLTLTGNNSYTGSTTISEGTLAVSGSGTVGSVSAVTVASGATLSSSVSSLSLGALAGAGTVSFGANELIVGTKNTPASFSGTLSGSGDFYKEGTGTLTLSGTNSSSFTGTTTVQHGGTLSVAGDDNLGSGTVTLNGGTLSVTGAGTIDNAFGIGNNHATISTTAAVTLSGVISAAGTGTLTKTGSGTLTLSGFNSYSGNTTVSAGTLLLTGSLGGGAVSVSTGATLGGTGTISGNVTVDSGATLAPGVAGSSNGIGTLLIGGNLTMNGILAIELASSSSYDIVSVSGNVTINSNTSGTTSNNAISVTRVNSYAATNTTYSVIKNTGSNPIGTTFPSLAEGGTLTTNGDLYTVSYAAGTGFDDLVLTAVVNPTVTSVSATTADGSYKAGDTVTVTVTFSRAVAVTGSPTLGLATGRTASYSGISGDGKTLSFTYTVQAGDTSADLDYVSTTALSLNGATILDSTTNSAATLTLAAPGAANSLGANKAIVIDTTAPAVTAVAVPADATYATGQTMDFTVTFNEAVTVTGTPTLPITLDNGEVVQATYLSGSGGTALTFRYTVGAGKLDADGIVLGSALGGGTIADAAGNAAALTLANVATTGGVRIDSVGPTVSAVTSPTADGTYGTGDTVTIQVSFSEAVTVSGTPTLTLNTGRTATYSGGSGGSVLSFTYVVQAGDTTADLDAGSLALNGGAITDTAGNPGTLALPGGGASLAGAKAIVIDTTPPSVVSVSVPADGAYSVGKTLSVTVRLSEAVIVNGTPTILLDIGGVQRVAVYNPAASNGTALRFDYVVQAGDNDADGITVKELSLNGASITDAARLPLPADLGGIPGTQGVLVDTLAPDAPSIPVLAAGQDSGSSATDGLTNVARPTVGGTAEPGSTVTVMVDGVARGTTTAGADGAWSLTFADPLADGAHAITTTATDRAGNVSPTSPALALTIDATPPVLSTPALAAGSDTGVSATDRITGVTRPTLTGSAEPNSSVRVILDGVVVGTATAGADGIWSFTVANALADGDHSVATEATDAAGNIGRSTSQTFTINTTAPGAPSVPTLASGDSGASASDGLTSTARPALTGTAPPNGTVTVYVDGTAVGTARADASGTWNLILASPLTDGTHRVQVSATDAAGNAGTQRSEALVLVIDTQAPTVTAGGTAPNLTVGGTAAMGAGVSLSDASTLDRVVVGLTNARAGDELVIGALPGGITATRDGNRIVLSGVASAADYQAAVRAIGLRSSAADPSFGGTATSRSITVSARDAAGNESGAATVSVGVPATTVPPPAPATTPVTAISGNGPSTNTASGSGSGSTGVGSSSLPSLPGGNGAAGGSGPTMGSSDPDAGRSVTLGSVGGSSSSTDAGRSVTLGSVGGSSSSTDAGRSVTLNSVGGQNGGGSSSSSSGLSGGSGSTGSSGGSPLGGGLGGGLGSGFGLGNGLGGGLGGAQGPFTGLTGPRTGNQPGTGTPQNGNTRGAGADSQGNGQPPQGTGPNPGSTPAGEGQNQEQQGQPQGQQPQDQPEGQGEGGADAPGGTAPQGTGADGKPADRADTAPVGRVAPGFAHQVARAHGGPAGASALLAALANHTLPGSRAA